MEEQIKALIEKYEKEKDFMMALGSAATEAQSKMYYQLGVDVQNYVISDLKQLLTTSQGNPESMV